MSPLLKNAVKSVQLGVDDFASGNPDRHLAAVRSLHAGILMLFKEALRRLSPMESDDALIKGRIVPKLVDGKVVFVGQGKRTVTTEQIRGRFKALGIAADWKRPDRVTEVRNDIEHHYTTATEQTLKGVISDSFLVVRHFMATALNMDPAEALGADTWQAMLSVSEVVEHERKDCGAAIASASWGSDAVGEAPADILCAECGALLLMPEGNDAPSMKCRACRHEEDNEPFVERALDEHFAYESYRAVKDGCSPPVVGCPHCGRGTYVVDEQCCAACGESCQHECLRCEGQIPVEELSDGNLCGWCAHMMSKDD